MWRPFLQWRFIAKLSLASLFFTVVVFFLHLTLKIQHRNEARYIEYHRLDGKSVNHSHLANLLFQSLCNVHKEDCYRDVDSPTKHNPTRCRPKDPSTLSIQDSRRLTNMSPIHSIIKSPYTDIQTDASTLTELEHVQLLSTCRQDRFFFVDRNALLVEGTLYMSTERSTCRKTPSTCRLLHVSALHVDSVDEV